MIQLGHRSMSHPRSPQEDCRQNRESILQTRYFFDSLLCLLASIARYLLLSERMEHFNNNNAASLDNTKFCETSRVYVIVVSDNDYKSVAFEFSVHSRYSM